MEKGLLRLGGLRRPQLGATATLRYATLLRYATERLVASRQQPWRAYVCMCFCLLAWVCVQAWMLVCVCMCVRMCVCVCGACMC